ncbi:MAG TPA: DegT/DnrJ/EryC1/StrS family aminotransferase [Vicinamibacterales bacterium]|nr:DegT/DnrJ/EryC1/StrS family aminotransferase [Vicinamibacterales bacterium]
MATQRIPLIKADLPPLESLEASFREILSSGRVTNFGRYVQQFEAEAGAYLGTEAVCLSSATAGLIMTMQALGVPRGSRVAMPSFSFVATGQAVLYAGCTPVFVDITEDGNVDPDDLRRVLRETTNVGAALLVHMYGLPCRTEEIASVVDETRGGRGAAMPVLYDAAHAFGSASRGVRVGGHGVAEIFSTSVTKVMTSVEGGIVSSHDAKLIARLKKMRNYGIEANYDAQYPGLNGKMSEFHALVGLQNLARLDDLLASRAERAAFYTRQIHGATSFRVMEAPAGTLSTYKDYTILLPPRFKARRDAIMEFLGSRGIETRAYFFPPIHEQTFFRQYADRPLPVTEDLSRRVITLPFYSTISEDEMRTVAQVLAEAEASCRPDPAGRVRQEARA